MVYKLLCFGGCFVVILFYVFEDFIVKYFFKEVNFEVSYLWLRIKVVGKVKVSMWFFFYKNVIYFLDEEVYFNLWLRFVKLCVVVKVDNLVLDLIEFIILLDKNFG